MSKNFMYLGSLVTRNGETEKDVKNTHQSRSNICHAKRNVEV